MPDTDTHMRKLATRAMALTVVACLGLSACGNSSSKSTTAAPPPATTNAAKSSHTPAGPGQASSSSRPRKQSRAHHIGTPAFRHALAAFATCMRHNGVKLSAPDTSGNGPVFKTGSIDTASATFKAASAKCQSVLRNAVPRPPQRAAQ